MGKQKILVVDDFPQKILDELAKHGSVANVTRIDETSHLNDVNVLVIRSKTKISKTLVDKMPNLGCVITATHGIDHVCVDYLRSKGIDFQNVPVQSRDVAEGVLAYILAHATNLVKADVSMKKERWNKKELKGCRVLGKTLGVIGYGNIGREVAKISSALGMNVVFHDPYIDLDANVALDELLTTSDYVTIHVPLTEETKGLIGKKEILKMKDGAFLINTARGGIVDEAALVEALKTGKLSGAALDVYEHHPPFGNESSKWLVTNDNVIASPHSIGQTVEALEEKGDGVIRLVKNYVDRIDKS